MRTTAKEQLKLILLCLFLLVLQFGVFNYLPFSRLVNLGLLASFSFSYFGEKKLAYVPSLFVLGIAFDFLGPTFQWGFFSLLFFLLFFLVSYLKEGYLRKANPGSYLVLFSFVYLCLIASYQFQNFLIFKHDFLDINYFNYLKAYLINIPPAIVFYYGNFFFVISEKRSN